MRIRILTLILMTSATFFTSCNENDDDANQTETLNGTWNLIKSTSPEDIDVNYEETLVTYNFDSSNGSLIVTNLAIETTDLSPKASGRLGNDTFSYNILDNNGENYLIVENQEIGRIILSQENSFILDQTETSSGTEITEFILTFER